MDVPEKKYVSKPSVVPVAFGILVIAAMYLLPIFPAGWFSSPVTLAKISEMCSSPFPLIRCPDYIPWLFMAGWGIGIISILLGIFNKIKE
jgi:hypothetical protein